MAVVEQEMPPVLVRTPLGELPGQPPLQTARDGVGGRNAVEREPRWVQVGARDHARLVSKEAILSRRRGVAAQHPRGME